MKIDTVNVAERGPVRRAYEALRGDYGNASPIVSLLPRAEGLAKTLPELVEWTVEAFKGFRLNYDKLWTELDRSRIVDDEELLSHFDGKPAFAEFRANWTAEETALFCRLARAVHDAGFDWWCVDLGGAARAVEATDTTEVRGRIEKAAPGVTKGRMRTGAREVRIAHVQDQGVRPFRPARGAGGCGAVRSYAARPAAA